MVLMFRTWYMVVYFDWISTSAVHTFLLIPIEPDGVTNYTILHILSICLDWFALLFINFKCETGCEGKI